MNSSTVRQNLMLAMKHIKSNKEKEQVLAETLSFLELLEFTPGSVTAIGCLLSRGILLLVL